MLKFKFNYLNQTLAYQKPFDPEYWYQIEESFEGNFGSQGFNLSEGWITFTIYANKIRVFYKQIQNGSDPDNFWIPQKIAYFRKDLTKQAEVIFTFSERDEVEKVGQTWVKKGGKSM